MTRERERRSSIWISVALRSWAAKTLLSFSGCDESDGGDSSSVLGFDGLHSVFGRMGAKSEELSKVTAGAMAGNGMEAGDVRVHLAKGKGGAKMDAEAKF